MSTNNVIELIAGILLLLVIAFVLIRNRQQKNKQEEINQEVSKALDQNAGIDRNTEFQTIKSGDHVDTVFNPEPVANNE